MSPKDIMVYSVPTTADTTGIIFICGTTTGVIDSDGGVSGVREDDINYMDFTNLDLIPFSSSFNNFIISSKSKVA